MASSQTPFFLATGAFAVTAHPSPRRIEGQLKRGCLGLRYPADVVFSPSCCSAHAPQAPGVLFRKGAGVEYCLFDAVADDQDLFSLWLGARIPIQAVPQ